MNTLEMNLNAFYAWYSVRAKSIISNSDTADLDSEILEKVEKLHIVERLNSMKQARKEIKWELILKAVSIGVSLLFNIFLVGCIFRYESFAPIITKCFGFVRPMPL